MNTDKLLELERKWRDEAAELSTQAGREFRRGNYESQLELARAAQDASSRADELAAALRAEQAVGDEQIALLIAGGYVTQAKVDEAILREIKKVNDYIKDYPECSGNPSSCPENEGYGCCKSARWRVIQFGGSFKRGTERWEVYEPNGSGGVVEESDIKDETVRRLLDYLAAAPGGEGEVDRG